MSRRAHRLLVALTAGVMVAMAACGPRPASEGGPAAAPASARMAPAAPAPAAQAPAAQAPAGQPPAGQPPAAATPLARPQAAQAAAEPPACRADATKIHAVQGRGAASPLTGRTVTIQGVVVGDFQKGDGDRPFATDLGGYAVQEEDHDADADPRTSEGIYVYDSRTDVAVGDRVRVTGRVTEFYDLTELTDVTNVVVCASGVELPTAARIVLPVAAASDLEAYEGMLVTFPQELVIGDHFDFDRYGELWLYAPDPAGRPRQPTDRLDPRDPLVAEAADHQRRARILLDDGRAALNPDPARHPNGEPFANGSPFGPSNLFRAGDRLANVTGVLDYGFGRYRVQPTVGAQLIRANPRPDVPAVGGDVRVAAFNVLNYFDDFGGACGPRGASECRGASDATEFRRQRDKVVAAIAGLDAHVVAIMEIENDANEGAIDDLVRALNAATAPGAYASVRTGAIGTDDIRVALVYQPARVTPVGAAAVLADAAFVAPRGGAPRNRPALAQTFAEVGSGAAFTVVANHLKSKGSACGALDDDQAQGNCNLTRTLAVERLMAWLATDPTGSGDPDFLVLGDLNSYSREDPIRAARAGFDGRLGTADDFTDLLAAFAGEDAYTYVFDGLVGTLDHAIASPSLSAQVTGAAAWHINADEPDILDYTRAFKTTAQRALYAADPYRSSDHDPVVVGLALAAD